MTERYFKIESLIRVQRATWYAALVYFAAVGAMYMLQLEYAAAAAYYGIIGIVAATALKLVFIAEQFRQVRLYRLWIMSYILVLILILIIAVRYLW